MSFPTTSILDNFNRADTTDITGSLSWVTDPFFLTPLGISGNRCANYGGGPQGVLWNNTYTDAEAYITLIDVFYDNNNVAVGARYVTDNGYFLYFSNGNGTQTLGFYKHVSGTASQIGTNISVSLVSGDKIGLSVIGTTLTAYTYTSGAWSSVGTQTDSTHSSGGALWLFANERASVTDLDDFGGGTVVAAATIFKRRSMGQRTGSRSGG